MASIRDVAKLAGVSPATVSRVINGTAKVNEEKEKSVLEAIQKTGFKPNEIARSLFKKSSRIIGYIVPNILNLLLNEMGRAIEDEAFKHGYKMILCNSDEDPQKETAYIKMLTSMNADGIIITSNNNSLDDEISDCPLPVVVFDKNAGTKYSASVQSDNYTGGKIATEHLIECGCNHIVHMRGPQRYTSGSLRYHGFVDACTEHGIEPLYIDSKYDFSEGILCAKELLEKFPNVDGIIAASDMVALSLYKVLYEQGRRVPDEIMIVGFDNVELSTIMTPTLTTIAQPIEDIGRLAVRIIIDMVENNKVVQRDNILPVSLKIRQTTKKKAAQDCDVL